MMSRRIRGKNFSDTERETLFALVNNYKQILDNRKNDVRSNKNKTHIWGIITKAFNSKFSGNDPRRLENLKMCYDNHRKRQKSLSCNRAKGMKRGINSQGQEIIVEEMAALKTESECLPDDHADNYEYYLGMQESTQQEPNGDITDTLEETPGNNCETEMPDVSPDEAPIISEELESAIGSEPFVHGMRKKKNKTTSDLKDFISNRTKRKTTNEQFEFEQHELKMKILSFDYESKVEQHKLKMTILETELKLKLKELNRYN